MRVCARFRNRIQGQLIILDLVLINNVALEVLCVGEETGAIKGATPAARVG